MNDMKMGFGGDILIFFIVFGPFVILALLVVFIVFMGFSVAKSKEKDDSSSNNKTHLYK